MKKTPVLISLVVLALGIFIVVSCENDKVKKDKAYIANQERIETEQASDVEPPKEVYTTDNINDENSAKVTEPSNAVSYWYVYFEAKVASPENEWEGFKIIELPTPYFDVDVANNTILPSGKENDFVGIHFFKRVPFETYNAYLQNRK
jgi:hypothetical protein